MGTINSALALAISDLCKKEKLPFFLPLQKAKKLRAPTATVTSSR